MYDYIDVMTEDVREAIKERADEINEMGRNEKETFLFDELFADDSVTGNASGSYFCNTWKAEEALAHNLGLLQEACEVYGGTLEILESPEAADVTIRCYLLDRVISCVLDEMEEEEEEE